MAVSKSNKGVFARKVIEINSPVPIERTGSTSSYLTYEEKKRPWSPFFDSKEHFPEFLASLTELSTTHAACIRSKADYVVGDGFVVNRGRHNTIFATPATEIEPNPGEVDTLMDWAQSVNLNGENLQDILRYAMTNKFGLGNVNLELVRGQAGGERFFYVYNHDATDVRLSREAVAGRSTHAYISRGWTEEYLKKNPPRAISLYPKWSRDGVVERTLINMPERWYRRHIYGIPSSITSLMHQKMEYKAPKYNLDKFENGFKPSAFIQFFAPAGMTKEEGDEFIASFNKSFTGEGNNGKICAEVVEHESMKSQVTMFDDTTDGNFLELNKDNRQQIITAHQWDERLAGVSTPGLLGNTQEVRNVYELKYNTVIRPVQNEALSRLINPVIREVAQWQAPKLADYYLTIANSSPVSFAGDIDINGTLDLDERRELLGYGAAEDEQRERILDERRVKAQPPSQNTQ